MGEKKASPIHPCEFFNSAAKKPEVETKLRKPRLKCKVVPGGIDMGQSLPVRCGCPFEDRQANAGNREQCQKGKLKGGLKPRRGRKHEYSECRKPGCVERRAVAIEKSPSKVDREHEYSPQNRRAKARHCGVKQRKPNGDQRG